jgi:hypothetical protein
MDPDNRVALAEIKGDIKLVLAGQDRSHTDILTLNKRLDGHDGRIRKLEDDKNARVGERHGLALGGRALWATLGFIPPAIVAVMKMLGA